MKKTLLLFGLFVLSYAAESHDDGYSDNGKPYKKPKTDIRRKNTQDVVPLYRKGNKQKATVPTYKIRQPQEKIPIKKLKPTIILDDKKLEDLKHQTQIAQQLLSDIFIEEENKGFGFAEVDADHCYINYTKEQPHIEILTYDYDTAFLRWLLPNVFCKEYIGDIAFA